MKKLVIYSPYEEYHTFIKFNVLLPYLRKYYDEIIAVIPEVASIIVTESDKNLIVSNNYLNSKGINYPQVYGQKNVYAILTNAFYTHAKKYVDEKYPDYEQLYYSNYFLYSSPQAYNSEPKQKILSEIFDVSGNLGKSYTRDFGWLNEWIENKILYPTEATFNKIKQKYSHLFKNKTYILPTRNFKNKQPDYNTKSFLPDIDNLIKFLNEKGIGIINIGFPLEPYSIKHENYYELHDSLTQDELLSLFYLGNGILQGCFAGGFAVNLASNTDIFQLTEEWGSFDICGHRAKNKNTKTVSLIPYKSCCINTTVDDYSKISEILLTHIPSNNKKFNTHPLEYIPD